MPGIVNSLVGVPVGSRVLAALAPKDAYGVQGQPAAGIGPTDTIVVLLDVKARAGRSLTRATGTPVAPRPGCRPSRSTRLGRAARSACRRATPPAALVVQPLIAGAGAEGELRPAAAACSTSA